MRMRVAGENQDESKWPIERHRTRRGRFESRQTSPQQTIIIHSSQRSQASQSTDYTQSVPPSKKDTASLKHAPRVRNATMTRHPTEYLLGRQSTMENERRACESRTRAIRVSALRAQQTKD